ncbi:MAG: SHD1 domain-containing protein, partial [Planctomycetia bacterium]|nr:SHD1 domain-containing protein [Planctomycetia bacterium]
MMKRSLLVLVVFFGIGFGSILPAQTRTWSDLPGRFTVEATFVSLSEDAKTVTLKKKDGTTVDVPLDKLSKADQAFVREKVSSSAAGERMPGLPQESSEKVLPSEGATLPVVTVKFPANKGAIRSQTGPFQLHCRFDSNPTASDVRLITSWQSQFDIRGVVCFFGDGGDEHIFDLLKPIRSIQECHFSNGVLSIKPETFSPDGLNKLETIEMDRCIAPFDAFAAFAKLPSLRTFAVNSISLSFVNIGHLRSCKSLKDLTIISEDADVFERTMENLGTLSNLETLRLQLPGLTTTGFLYIPDLTTLKHLEFVQTPIPPQYITHFQRFQQLRTLVLEDCPELKSESIEIIRALLPQCQVKLQRDKKVKPNEQTTADTSKPNTSQSKKASETDDASWLNLVEPKSSRRSSDMSSEPGLPASPAKPDKESANVATSSWAGIHIGDSIEEIKKNFEILESGKSPNSDCMIYRIKPKQRKYSEIIVVCRDDRCISILIHFTANTPETYALLYQIHNKRFPSYRSSNFKTVVENKAS